MDVALHRAANGDNNNTRVVVGNQFRFDKPQFFSGSLDPDSTESSFKVVWIFSAAWTHTKRFSGCRSESPMLQNRPIRKTFKGRYLKKKKIKYYFSLPLYTSICNLLFYNSNIRFVNRRYYFLSIAYLPFLAILCLSYT